MRDVRGTQPSPRESVHSVSSHPSMFGPPYGGPTNYGTAPHLEEGYNRKVPERIHRTRFSIAYLSTVAQLVVYSGPVIIGVQLGLDPDAGYWIGRYGVCCFLVPLFIAILHGVHLYLLHIGRPAKLIFILMAIIPGAIITYTGAKYSGNAKKLYGVLSSEDCTKRVADDNDSYGFQLEKYNLQEAYEKAVDTLDECRKLEKAVQKKEYQLPDVGDQGLKLSAKPTLLNCQDWAVHGHMHDEVTGWSAWAEKTIQQERRYRDEFNYLAAVEANNLCGGFCEAGPMLWMDFDQGGKRGASGERHAACAPIVAAKMKHVARQSSLNFWLGFSCAIFLCICFQLAKPLLEYLGYKANPWSQN